jgi:hypothetical protein
MATVAESTGTVNFDQTLTTDTRAIWREAVSQIADKAKATLPQSAGRIDKAVALVLNGDVEVLGDGTARVASQSNGETVYHIVNGHCDCKDYPKAPDEGWCKHRLSAAIAKRAYPLAKTKLEAASAPTSALPAPTLTGTVYCAACQATFHAPHDCPRKAAPLPEAPASVNVHLELAGRQVQLTLRDLDETRLLARLDAILQRFPLVVKPTDTQAPAAEGWCRKHGIAMRQNHKDGRSWWSHNTADGWCKGVRFVHPKLAV